MPPPTANELLAIARKRLAELEKEVEALRAFLAHYTTAAAELGDQKDSSDQQLSLYHGGSVRARKARLNDLLVAARRIVVTEGRPMKRGEIVQRLLAQGHEIEGKDKNKVFGTILWRSRRFESIEGQGYWPSDVVLPGK